jgi:P27 family predicted phage terminase small subunit
VLTGEALAEWHRVVPELARLRLTKQPDAAGLTAYCLTWQRLLDAQAVVAVEGLLHEGKQGLVRHPALGVVVEASKELRAWCAEFGLTPAAEAKVSRGGEAASGADAADPFGAVSG